MKRVWTCALCLALIGLLGVNAAGLSIAASAAPRTSSSYQTAVISVDDEEEPKKEEEIIYDPNISMMVRYDYDDQIRMGVVVPAFIDIENRGPAVDGLVRLSVTPDGSDKASVYEMPIHLEQGGAASVTVPFRSVGDTVNIKVHLLRDGEILAQAKSARKRIAVSNKMLVGVLSENPEGMFNRSSLGTLLDDEAGQVNTAPVELSAADFPEQFYLLDRFALIVLNHFDLGHLSEQQRGALERWVKGGGRLLLDGDVNNAPAIRSLGSILALEVTGALSESDAATALGKLADKTYPADKGLQNLGKLQPTGTAVAGESANPVITEYSAGKGKVFVTAFALDDPFFQEKDAAAVFQKIRGLSAWTASQLEMKYGYYGSSQPLRDAVRSISWLDAPTISWVLVLLLGFIALAGPVSYLLLSKKDKRDLIWVTAPILSVVCCGIIIAFGAGSHGSQTVSSVVTVVDSRGGAHAAESYSMVGVAAPKKGSYELLLEEDAFPYKQQEWNYYYSNSSGDEQPVGKPATRFDMSGYPKITFANIQQWNMDSFMLQRDIPMEGKLECRIRYLPDGAMYTIRNNTGMDLEDVTIVSQQGYYRIPLLESGEEQEGVMEPYAYMVAQAKAMAKSGKISYSSYYGYGGGLDYWSIISEFYSGGVDNGYIDDVDEDEDGSEGEEEAEKPKEDTRTEEEKREDYLKSCMVNALMENSSLQRPASVSGMQDNSTIWAWSRELGAINFTANGKAVRNDLNRAMIIGSVEIDYEGDGELAIPLGQIPGKIEETKNVTNGSVMAGESYAYFTSGEVTFGFTLPEYVKKYTIDQMVISAASAYGDFSSLLYNNRTGEWDRFDMETEMKGDSVQDYVGSTGKVLLKITSDVLEEDLQKEDDENSDIVMGGRGEINMDYPTISVSGRGK